MSEQRKNAHTLISLKTKSGKTFFSRNERKSSSVSTRLFSSRVRYRSKTSRFLEYAILSHCGTSTATVSSSSFSLSTTSKKHFSFSPVVFLLMAPSPLHLKHFHYTSGNRTAVTGDSFRTCSPADRVRDTEIDYRIAKAIIELALNWHCMSEEVWEEEMNVFALRTAMSIYLSHIRWTMCLGTLVWRWTLERSLLLSLWTAILTRLRV